jgi:hypothetical protein
MGMLNSADIARMTRTVERSFDTTITVKRDPSPVQDSSGHQTQNLVVQGEVDVNTYKPNAGILQSYAEVIGSQQALMIRYSTTDDIREGDVIEHIGLDWLVHNAQKDESYTFCYNALIVTVT